MNGMGDIVDRSASEDWLDGGLWVELEVREEQVREPNEDWGDDCPLELVRNKRECMSGP